MNHNEEPAKSRRRFTERLACTLVFTVLQLWAAVVIAARFDGVGVVALAVALVLAGALVAVHDAWREVRSVRKELDVEIREELVRL
ncbi:hypothetical protein [Saccharothrix yanglingensis]|uniref:Uncharacterized protein n=1 Tax=Saccharothrix yanglingensis TaxID=659496 RepID=A0ABU0XCR2_9PSEU|nr:hypothetical protein [Saccharothrix yanglingensis]MDQ2589019.1 hypothetical protein [Saccharothrix yanglingensis]